jgi:hypothetical protein
MNSPEPPESRPAGFANATRGGKAMTQSTTRRRHFWLAARDALLGFGIFAVLALAICGGIPGLSNEAAASDALISEALALSSPPGAVTENALIAALVGAPSLAAALPRRIDFVVLAATFALMFAMNLAIMRHLRRVYASPRRSAGRRGR